MNLLGLIGVLVVAAIFLLMAASLSGSFCFAIELCGPLGIVYWVVLMCTGIGAFFMLTFGFIYWLEKINKDPAKTNN